MHWYIVAVLGLVILIPLRVWLGSTLDAVIVRRAYLKEARPTLAPKTWRRVLSPALPVDWTRWPHHPKFKPLVTMKDRNT